MAAVRNYLVLRTIWERRFYLFVPFFILEWIWTCLDRTAMRLFNGDIGYAALVAQAAQATSTPMEVHMTFVATLIHRKRQLVDQLSRGERDGLEKLLDKIEKALILLEPQIGSPAVDRDQDTRAQD